MLIALVLLALVGTQAAPRDVREFPITLAAEPAAAAPPGPASDVVLRLPFSGSQEYEVTRLVRVPPERRWRLAAVTRGSGERAVLRAPAGLESLLVVRSPNAAGYLLDGPFRWPLYPSTYEVAPHWRRTIRGTASADRAGALEWLPSEEGPLREGWPACAWTDDRDWECIGVPLRLAGVVLAHQGAQLGFGVAPAALTGAAVEHVPWHVASWGRLVIARTGHGIGVLEHARIEAVAWRAMVPRARPGALRLELLNDPRATIARVSGRAFWISARLTLDDGWVEIGGSGLAPARVEIADLQGAPPELPLNVSLEPALEVRGRVLGGPDVPAGGAHLALFRILGGGPPGREPRRLLVTESTAAEDGTFRFGDLGMERYELVAMHPALGRGERRFAPDGQDLDLVLRRPPQAIGRVMRDGVPAARTRVVVVPDLEEFAATDDMTLVRGGETLTDEDGRFVVSLASRGAGELRVGDGAAGVRRIPLAPAESLPPTVDVGTVELGASASVTFVLEGAEGCDLLLIGPAGRAGLTVVRTTRRGPATFHAAVPEPGRWMVAANCGGQERAVEPGAVEVKAGAAESTVPLSWPRGGQRPQGVTAPPPDPSRTPPSGGRRGRRSSSRT